MKNKKIVISILLTMLLVFQTTLINAKEEKDKQLDESEIDPSVVVTRIEEIVRAGTYFVSISTMNELKQVTSKLVRVHVKFPRTILDYKNEEGIDAHDMVVHPGTFEGVTEKEAIQKADARAWDLTNGSNIDIFNVDISKAPKDSGASHKVIFSTKRGSAVSTYVYEQEEINLPLDEVYENRKAVLNEKLGIFSSLLLGLLVLPVGINLIIVQIIKITYKKSEKVLYD